MKTTLDHLPPRKQDELRAVVDVLRAGVPMSMLILFGSHARGDWVEDPEEGYFSDYDLLAIVQSPQVVDDAALWSRLEDLVFTGYKRREHSLQKLHDEAAPVHPDIASVLPRTTPEDKHLFNLLRRAYIDARYDKGYRITAEELARLGERVRAFAAVVERVCQEKIASLRAAAEGAGPV